MKCTAIVLGIVLCAATVGAQSNFNAPGLPADQAPAFSASLPAAAAPALPLFADAAPGGAEAAPTAAAYASSDAAAAQGPILGVRPTYDWEFYAGYTFYRFYEVPSLRNTENGFDLGVTYFPNAGWIGFEGDLMATFGSQAGCISKFTLPSGGVRLRWVLSSGARVWVHGTVGGAHFFPQTAYGGQNAFAYQMGGGLDIPHGRRLAFRIEADAVGTRFFQSYQYSPKISAGIVFQF